MTPEPKLIRPVKCHFCNQLLFYSSDEQHELEVRVTVVPENKRESEFYAHVRCWNERVATK